MSQKCNPTVIGAFVLVGAALAVGTSLILSSGRWLKETFPYVMNFEGDVSGLRPGAPVQYRGVTIGTVKEVKLVIDQEKGEAYVPVLVEFDPQHVSYVGDEGYREEVASEIRRGLRAQLQSQSLVTGMLKVMLVDAPHTEIRLLGSPDPEIPEIPTIPGFTESMMDEFRKLRLNELVDGVNQTVENLNRLTSDLTDKELVANLNTTLAAITALSESVKADLPNVTGEFMAASKSAREVLDGVKPLGEELREKVPPMLEGLDSNSEAFFELQQNTLKALTEIQQLLNRNSTGRYQINDALAKLSAMAAQAQQLMDFIERHPEAFLTGKPQP